MGPPPCFAAAMTTGRVRTTKLPRPLGPRPHPVPTGPRTPARDRLLEALGKESLRAPMNAWVMLVDAALAEPIRLLRALTDQDVFIGPKGSERKWLAEIEARSFLEALDKKS